MSYETEILALAEKKVYDEKAHTYLDLARMLDVSESKAVRWAKRKEAEGLLERVWRRLPNGHDAVAFRPVQKRTA